MKENGNLTINSENLFPIIKKWLYSDTDIFVRELVSNGVDAISKVKKLVSLGEAKADDEAADYRVCVRTDENAKTITISDNGLGMTADEVKKYINQVAFSGACDFIEKYKDAADDPIIGHFGLGFYSAFMVAENVEIQTLSYQDDAAAVSWQSDGESTYEMDSGTRQTRGTDIILHVNEDGEAFLKEAKMRAVLEKYCSFMPVEIFLNDDDKAINETAPLWTKSPKECTDEEYKAFYTQVFSDYKEPLFWIHLNMDYPFRLQGILYFPKLGHELEASEGQVKLYCNQVFVADNVKEVIPEFLLLLKGTIDCPDIPLNVSRSFLQNDGYVTKISDYITRKVADKLKSLFKEDREAYEKYWSEIHPFVKYGCLRNEKFEERVREAVIYKSVISDKFITLDEYLEEAKTAHENKVFYASDVRSQANYVETFKRQNMDVVLMNSAIDSPFMNLLENKKEGLAFLRVDANVGDMLKSDVERALSEDEKKAIEDFFKSATAQENLKLRVESLKDESLSAFIEINEQTRRMNEMMRLYGNDFSMPNDETLVLNQNHPLVKKLIDDRCHPEIAMELYDLARIQAHPLEAKELYDFIQRSEKLMNQLLEGESHA